MRLILILAMFWLAFLPVPATAQTESGCFWETGQCIGAEFRAFWEENGGLAAFGYPITPSRVERSSDTLEHQTQWFERNRFELHERGVVLGRLGDERLRQKGIDWQALPKAEPEPGCDFYRETGHNLCDQVPGVGFKTYWAAHGGLSFFGFPLTEVKEETNDAGDSVLTQWFERARLEWHPGNEPVYQVLLGLLGREMGMAAPLPDRPAPPTPPRPIGPVVAINHQAVPGSSSTRTAWIGEIRNDTGVPVIALRVSINVGGMIFDDIATVWSLQPGQRAPFRVEATGVDRRRSYSVSVRWLDAPDLKPHGLQILSHRKNIAPFPNPSGRPNTVTGMVRNNGPSVLILPRVVATFYDSDGKVTYVGVVNFNFDRVAPGTQFPFQMPISSRQLSQRYEIQADGIADR